MTALLVGLTGFTLGGVTAVGVIYAMTRAVAKERVKS